MTEGSGAGRPEERTERENRTPEGGSAQQGGVKDESKPQAAPVETPAGKAATDEPGAAAGSVESVLATTDAQAEVIGVRHGMFGMRGSGDTSGYGGLVRTVSMPAPAQRPYGGPFDEIADVLGEGVREGAIESVVVDRGEITFHIRREYIREVAQVLRDDPDLRFELLANLSGVHYPEAVGRELHVVYNFLSITHNRRIRAEVSIPDADPHVPSLVPVYPTADWQEREAWDFFGIVFDGHPALTRIEMPDDWPGHPQRKDYPLGGIPVEYKGATIPPPDTRRSYS